MQHIFVRVIETQCSVFAIPIVTGYNLDVIYTIGCRLEYTLKLRYLSALLQPFTADL